MKQGWEVKNFEDCIEKVIYTNKIQRKDFLENGEYPVISQEQDFINGYWNNSDDLFEVKRPIVIFGDHTQVLKYVDFDFVLGADGVKILQSKKEIEPRYFYYYLQNINLGSLGYARHYRLLKEIQVNYPKSLPEQQRIVAILDEAFTAIEGAKANAMQNLKNAKELFDSYLQSVFENRGEGWKRVKVDEICESIIDCINKTAPIVTEQTPYKMIRTTNVRFGKVDLSSVRYVTEKTYIDWTRRQKPKIGDILFTREAPMGEVGMLLSDDNVFLGQRIVSYRIDDSKVDGKFLLYGFQSNDLKNQIKKLASGATVQHLRVPDTKSFKFSIPTLSEQQTIVQKLDLLSAETKRLEAIYQQKIECLEELKKSILQKAFNGEL